MKIKFKKFKKYKSVPKMYQKVIMMTTGLLEITPPDAMDEAVFGFVDDVAVLSIGKTLTVTHRKLGHMMG